MSGDKKRPRTNETVQGKLVKAVENPYGFYARNPSWRFSKMDTEHKKWSFSAVLDNATIVRRLSDYEKQMWSGIIGDRNHYINVAALIKEAQDRLNELGLYYDRLFSLTVNGRERIFGILEDGALFFLWYDKRHEICPSHKTHT